MWNHFFFSPSFYFFLVVFFFLDEKHGNVVLVSSQEPLFERPSSSPLTFFLFSLDYFYFYQI